MNKRSAAGRRVGIYARISKDDTGEQVGVQRQLDACRDLASGAASLREYVDNSVSASTSRKRAGFEALLADVDAGRVDAIVCWSADRLWRKPADLERLVRVLEPSGVEVLAVTSGDIDLSTADGRAMARVFGAFGAREVEKMSERIKAALADNRAHGRYHCGSRPFGWVREPDGWHTHPEESAYLTSAYPQILAGASLGSVARQWDRPGATGGRWTTVQLRAALLNGRQAGILIHKGVKVADIDDGRRIIDEPTYWQVRAILTDPARKSPRGRPRTSLLGGFVRCGRCGLVMQSTNKYEHNPETGKRDRPRRVYVCQRGGQHLTRSVELADGPILALIAVTLERHRDALAAAAERAMHTDDTEATVAQLEERLGSLRRLAVDGAITADDFASMASELRERMEQARREAAPSPTAGLSRQLLDADDIETALRELLANDPPAARAIVTEIFESITLIPVKLGQAAGPEHLEYVVKGWAS